MNNIIVSFKKIRIQLKDLLSLAYIDSFFQSKINGIELKEHTKNSIQEIDILLTDESVILTNYQLYVEHYYTLLNFYQELLEDSSEFASKNICSMFTLYPSVGTYHDYFPLNLKEYEDFQIENPQLFLPSPENPPKDTISPIIIEQLKEITDIIYEFVQQKKLAGELITSDMENILITLENFTDKHFKNEPISIEDSYLMFYTLDKLGEIFCENEKDKNLLQQSQFKILFLKPKDNN